jgi:hypothetical protein
MAPNFNEHREGGRRPLLSTSDVALVLGFRERTIRKMAFRGDIPGAVFVGIHVKFRPEVIAEFVAGAASEKGSH